MRFSELLHPPGDKASLGDMALLKSKLPARATAAIPSCMYTEDKRFDYEVLILHAWIIARRETPDITEEEVGNLIGLKAVENLDQIEKEILFFFTRRTREDIDDHFKMVEEAVEKARKAAEAATEAELDSSDELTEVSSEVEKSENPQEQEVSLPP